MLLRFGRAAAGPILTDMRNVRLRSVYTLHGKTVHAHFDLSDQQLFAVAHTAEETIAERYRGRSLDADDALRLRELVALHDGALARAADGYDGGTLSLSLPRLGLLARTLREWLTRHERLGSIRALDAVRAPLVEDLLGEVDALHARALRAAIGAAEPLAVCTSP